MAYYRPVDCLETHVVTNKVPSLEDDNLWLGDVVLREAVVREGGAWASEQLAAAGSKMGSATVREWGELANRYTPELAAFDRSGQRVDEVAFHPAYHQVMGLAMEVGVHSVAWTAPKGGNVVHTALEYMLAQVETGVCCPMTMTYASVPVLAQNPDLNDVWRAKLLSRAYDPSSVPADQKTACTVGMAMTEKQGGSDVRTNTTRAQRVDGGDAYILRGHKWFCSAPMSDGFLTLAQADHGLTCFFVPRWTPDGERNGIRIQRLKDKLGNRSNASSEIEYFDAWAQRVGEEGRGIRTIIEMVHHTRLDCTLAAAGIMRQSVAQAMHYARHRVVFGKVLKDQPLMQNVLADLAIEVEAATVLSMRIARAFDESPQDPQAASFARLAVAVGKFWNNKRVVPVVGEAMECWGGPGYVEDSPLPRLYREAPVNGIWEGSGNVICLDILRALAKSPESLQIVMAELETTVGLSPDYDRHIQGLKAQLGSLQESTGRRFAQDVALALQGSLLLQHSPESVSGLFCATRLGDRWGGQLGTLPVSDCFVEIVERAMPEKR